MHNESPPVKIEGLGLLSRAAKPLPQHLQSPLTTTQLSARQVSSDLTANAAPVLRETVEMDPLLMSMGATTLGGDEPAKLPPPPLPPKPAMTAFPSSSSFPGSLTPTTTSTPPPTGYARASASSQMPSANSSNNLQSTPAASPPQSSSSSFLDDVAAFLSNCRTIPLDPSTVPATPSGLQTFARASAWQYVVTLSAQLMQEQGPYSDRHQGHIPTVLKLRLEGLFRMKMFDELTAEAGQILDVEMKRQRLESAPERSFDLTNAMHLLQAEVLSMTGRGDEASTQLHALLHRLAQSAEPSAAFWSWKTRNCLVNAAVRQRQWRAAMGLLMDMLGEIRRAREGGGPSVEDATRAEIVLLCRLSRTMLQLGAIRAGVGFCRQAEERFAALGREQDDVGHHVELARGLVMFSQDQVPAPPPSSLPDRQLPPSIPSDLFLPSRFSPSLLSLSLSIPPPGSSRTLSTHLVPSPRASNRARPPRPLTCSQPSAPASPRT